MALCVQCSGELDPQYFVIDREQRERIQGQELVKQWLFWLFHCCHTDRGIESPQTCGRPLSHLFSGSKSYDIRIAIHRFIALVAASGRRIKIPE